MSLSGETLWRRLAHGVRRLYQRADWGGFAGPDWPERIMSAAVTDRFHAKQGRSTGRWILHAEDRCLTVYLKRHYRLEWWRGILATLFPGVGWSPAWQEWQHLQWARDQGMPVPATVAAGEYIGPWGRLQSFLAIEELNDMLPLNEAIPVAAHALSSSDFQNWKRGLVVEMARLVRVLHQKRCFHKDLYLCHFYVPRSLLDHISEWRGQVHIIDLHRLGQHPWTWRWWQMKDLAQLLYSSAVAGVGARDRLRFWAVCLGVERRSFANRLLRLAVRVKWWNYRRHNSKRK